MIALVVALSVYAFQPSGKLIPLTPGQEMVFRQNKLQIDPPSGAVEVIDARGRSVVERVEGNVVYLKAYERFGFVCGPMTVKSGSETFAFRVRPHHGKCEDHKH